jgi:D-alanyl-D-alanine carboxypeptidase/D-alanyl-D-alanine-endopeptidase (penicillin-binding protein 4)
MKTLVRIAVLLWLCTSVCFAAHKHSHSKRLADRIDAILDQGKVTRGFWGIQIEDLDSGRVLYSRNADKLLLPASNAKLFVTAAALALIGPDYRFRTTIESSAPPDKNGVLHGNLYLVGRGDPNLSGRELPYDRKTERPLPPEHLLEKLADEVVAKGVKAIQGDIVADDSYFVDERYGDGWTQEDLVWRYGAPVSALAINDNVVFFHLRPGAAVGEPAILTVAPASGYYEVENRVRTTAARRGARRLSIDRQPGSRKIKIWGTMPINDRGTSRALSIEEPADFCAGLLAEMLARHGVALYGRPRSHHLEMADLESLPPGLALNEGAAGNLPGGGVEKPSSAEPSPVVLAQHESLPLGEDIRVINKVSQNLHAEMLLRLLGRKKGGEGSVAAGLEVVGNFLTQAGVKPEEYRLYDGSGLSRDDLITPRATVKLLRYAATQSWGAEFLDSLPQAGVDGTLIYRLHRLPRRTVVRAKTGSLDHVGALSGYMTTSRGRRLAFSIFANHNSLSAHQTNMVIDRIVAAVARGR